MKYSIDKYLLLEAAQDVAVLKSAHKTKVAEQYDSAIDTTHDTNKVERSKKLISETTQPKTNKGLNGSAVIVGAAATGAAAGAAAHQGYELYKNQKNTETSSKAAEMEPKNSTDELGEKLNNGTFKHETITETAATAQQTQPNHFQRNGGKYAAAAGVATGAGAYAYNNPEQTHQQMSSIAQKGQELYNSGKDVVQNKMNGLQSAIEQQANKVGTQSGDLKNIQSAMHELINNPQRVQQELQSIASINAPAVPDAPAVPTQTQAVSDVPAVATSPLPKASTLKMIQKESNVPYGPTETGDDFRLRVLAGQATPDEMRNFVKYDPKGFLQVGQDRVAQIRLHAADHKADVIQQKQQNLIDAKNMVVNGTTSAYKGIGDAVNNLKAEASAFKDRVNNSDAAKKLADSEALRQKKEASYNDAQARINAAKLLNKKFQDNQNSVPSVEHHEYGY